MRRFVRDHSGAAAVEFGLVAPIIAAVLVGIGTMGGLILAYNKMSQAVSAGAQYAMTISPDDTAAIEAAVTTAWAGMPEDGNITVTQACVCGSATAVCDAVCTADGDYPEKTTTITATMSYTDFTGTDRNLSSRQEVRTW